MMRRLVFLLFGLMSFSTVIAETKVVVDVRGEISNENIKKVFASKIVSAIARSSEYTAVEINDNFRSAVDDEHVRQTSGEVREDDIFRIRQRYGANYIAAVELTELFGELFASSHLIDAETTKVVYAFDASGRVSDMYQLTSLADNLANGIIIEPFREKKKQKEEKEKQAREREANLREKAIYNIIPTGTKIVGKYLVKDYPIQVNVHVDRKTLEPSLEFEIPAGYRMADAGIVEYLQKIGEYLSTTGHWYILLSPQLIAKSNSYGGIDYLAQLAEYRYYNSKKELDIADEYASKVFTTKNRKKKSERGNYNHKIGVIAYRDAPSESAIQAEISRLRSLGE